jgi:predicted nuclease of predicted toxin-antitoxin system
MNLYLDDDSAKASLAALLRQIGHQVVLPVETGTSGVADPRHLTYTVQQDLVLITRNHNDFEDLHNLVQATGGQHPGLMVVRLDNDPTRDMKDRDIARAISNLEQSGVPIANDLHILNHWR